MDVRKYECCFLFQIFFCCKANGLVAWDVLWCWHCPFNGRWNRAVGSPILTEWPVYPIEPRSFPARDDHLYVSTTWRHWDIRVLLSRCKSGGFHKVTRWPYELLSGCLICWQPLFSKDGKVVYQRLRIWVYQIQSKLGRKVFLKGVLVSSYL